MSADANLGIVVLTNAQNANLFCAAVRSRVLELAFGQPMELDEVLSARLEQVRQRFQDKSARGQSLDPATVAPYPGVYRNEALGEVRLALKGDRLMLEAGGSAASCGVWERRAMFSGTRRWRVL